MSEPSVGINRLLTTATCREDWDTARREAGVVTNSHEDMHGGELETSLVLHLDNALVGDDYATADHAAASRPDLLTLGMAGYTGSGIIGRPSLGEAAKGLALLSSLSRSFLGARATSSRISERHSCAGRQLAHGGPERPTSHLLLAVDHPTLPMSASNTTIPQFPLEPRAGHFE